MMPNREHPPRKLRVNIAFKTAVGYLILGTLWILLSDHLVTFLAPTPEAAARWQTYKGWGYVAVTSFLLYAILQVYVARRQRAEQALRRSEAELAAIVENAPFVMMIVDEDRRVQKINHHGAEYVGRSPEEMLGLRGGEALRCIHALDHPRGCGYGPECEACLVRNAVLHTLHTGESRRGVEARMTFRTPDGPEMKTLLVFTTPIAVAGEPRVMVVIQDITERKRAEDAVRESEAKFRTLFNSAGDAIFIHRVDGGLVEVNDEAVQRLGYDRQDLLQRTLADVTPPREPLQRIRELGMPAERPNAPKSVIVETEQITCAGEAIPTELSSRLITYEGSPAVLSVARDITERQRMEEQLHQQQRLAAVGQLAAGVAHDFRNLLTTILLYAQMDREHPDLPARVALALDVIMEESKKAADLVQQMLDFSSRAMIQREPLHLDVFLGDLLDDLLRRTIPENIRMVLETRPPDDGASHVVRADRGRLQQVVMNLALNARDAMPEGGELRFAVSAVQVVDHEPAPVAGMEAGPYVCLRVTDTGMGMTDEVQDHLFEPFFTTKDVDEGTGLGLAQVYGIVRQHHGRIDAASTVGEGTTFRIYLPRAAEDEGFAAAPKENPGPTPRGRGETLLVVEDAQEILQAVHAGLTSLDYHVLTAEDGREALAILADEEVDLVLTDVVMPDMGGKALLQELRALRPDLPVVAMTGHVLDEDGQALKEVGFSDVIGKPFSMPRLATLIRASLDGGDIGMAEARWISRSS